MKKNSLGLPLEYSTLSKYYDALTQGNDDSKNTVIEAILKKHHVKTVLDLTCGTGAQTLFLAKKGYQVVGGDISPALLEIARDKAKQDNLDIEFIEGDMRTIKVGHFDALITIFNAIGHLTKDEFERALQNISNNLKAGGIYIFDILNLEAMTDATVTNLAMNLTTVIDDTTVHNIQRSTLDKESGLLTSYDEFSIQEGSDKPQIFKDNFTLQLYTSQELQEMLTRNGFEVLDQYGIDGSKFSKKTTKSILTIAKKIG